MPLYIIHMSLQKRLNNLIKTERFEASKTKDSVLSKYVWLKNYHNNAIKTFEDGKIEGIYRINI